MSKAIAHVKDPGLPMTILLVDFKKALCVLEVHTPHSSWLLSVDISCSPPYISHLLVDSLVLTWYAWYTTSYWMLNRDQPLRFNPGCYIETNPGFDGLDQGMSGWAHWFFLSTGGLGGYRTCDAEWDVLRKIFTLRLFPSMEPGELF